MEKRLLYRIFVFQKEISIISTLRSERNCKWKFSLFADFMFVGRHGNLLVEQAYSSGNGSIILPSAVWIMSMK
ncbi:hypothetical protein J6TS1_38920 [Siminovitchia terrae]|uniref:Uncharacterized protein n=1 Tax=Siminovitchia terrae TaxID=1914933 RepID=A0ABQ4L210_SIMTE|nr:hypothetical protein J6TS1_38920 [Siminovitchia terrae]